MQPDPELAEGPASGGRVALFAVAIALVLGAVFYGLNNSIGQPGRHLVAGPDRAQTQPASPAAPPGMRDVTPARQYRAGHDHRRRPAQPQTPPATAPTQMNRPANPPAEQAT